MLREDDDDIAELIGKIAAGEPIPQPPATVTPIASRRSPAANAKASSRAKVVELSGELAAELQRNTVASAAPAPVDYAQVIAEHHAPVRGPARLLQLTADQYHRRPGLSSSIAKTLIDQTPLHAWTQHPLFGARGKPPTKAMDTGAVVHALVLGAGKQFDVLAHDSYRTKAAQEDRDAARGAGLVPILAHELAEAERIAGAIVHQLGEHGIALHGKSEVALEWWEQAADDQFVRCRGMLDHLWLDRGVILDLKITHDASPAAVERSAENFGHAIQRAAYVRAVTALRPELAGRVDFLFAHCEPEPPYAVNVVRGDGVFRELGERRWMRAVTTWGRCLRDNSWPSYGQGINSLAPPAWALSREGYSE